MSADPLHLDIKHIEEWPTLVPLDAPDLPNLELAHLPGWAGDYAQAVSDHSETPPELAAAMVLVTCSAAAARRLSVLVHDGYHEPCNLWAVVALPPGNRKSAVQSAVTTPLLWWERQQATRLTSEIKSATSERKTMMARAKQLRSKSARTEDASGAADLAKDAADLEARLPEIPIPPRLWTSDATPERLGVMMAEHGECMAWLSSEGGIFELLNGRYSKGIPNLDLVLKAHSGDPERVDRGSRPEVFLEYPRLTVGLTPQPAVLRGLAATPGFRGRGLLARFLYLLPPSNLGFRSLASCALEEGKRTAYTAGLRAMLDWDPRIGTRGREETHTLKLSREAYDEWRAFAEDIERQMRPGQRLDHFTDWAGKAPGAAARLAGVLHGIKFAHTRPWDTEIESSTMANTVAIMRVITCHSLAALDLMGADKAIADARHVWRWIERSRKNQFSIRDAFNQLRGTFSRTHKLRVVLDILEERGYLVIADTPQSGPGRPPSPTVRVRPELASTW